MRDPKRIDEITQKLNKIWHKYPDLRFWQLLTLIPISEVCKSKDLFYVEDNVTLETLKILEERGIK